MEEDQGKAVEFAYALPYSYSELNNDLEEAKTNLLKHTDKSKMEPKLKYLTNKQYIDYNKYKNWNRQYNDETVALINTPLLAGGSDEDGFNTDDDYKSNGKGKKDKNLKILKNPKKQKTDIKLNMQ